MVDRAVNKLTVKADVAVCLVGVQRRAGLNPCADACLDGGLLNFLNDRGNDLAASLQRTVDGNFVCSTSAVNLALAVRDVHVLGEATDVCLVGLDSARQLLKGSACHSEANPVNHEPRRLLCHAKGTAQLTRRDAILRIGDEPNRREPLVKAQARVLRP